MSFGLTAYDLYPSAADTGYINAIADINIKVELSNGLEFKEGWDPPDEFVKSDSQSATWQPEPVDRRADTSSIAFPVSREIEIEAQLTSDKLGRDPEGRAVHHRLGGQ